MLTVLTPYWGREETLCRWIEAFRAARIPEVYPLLLLVGREAQKLVPSLIGYDIDFLSFPEDIPGHKSIGAYHNVGAAHCKTEWIMKMDVDALPHEMFFHSLLPVLQKALPKEWFNVGMFYLDGEMSREVLESESLPASLVDSFRQRVSFGGTNFVSRRNTYLKVAECPLDFQGWGWEDYLQIYRLEKNQNGNNPLSGMLDIRNITQKCRDEISRRKAAELLKVSPKLALFHLWHPVSSREHSENNRRLLLEHISKS